MKNITIAILGIVLLTSCNKEWLNEKSKISIVVPTTLKDFRAILDATSLFNENSPSLIEISTDDCHFPYSRWLTQPFPSVQNAYVWKKELYDGDDDLGDWSYSYERVFHCNVVLEGIEKIDKYQDIEEWNSVKGSALFLRAEAFLNVAKGFADGYAINGNDGIGIPLRLTPNVFEESIRSSASETYTQIIDDLLGAKDYLPLISSFPTRPNKASAFGMLARVYLFIENYDKALAFADSCLQITNQLIDFNQLDTTQTYAIQGANSEILFQSNFQTMISGTRFFVDTMLFNLYENGDLRKSIYFNHTNNGINFTGSYSEGNRYVFCGLATNEILLIRAECFARSGLIEQALLDLNRLLKNRYISDEFKPINITNTEELLTYILEERRKELPFRGIRWLDLKRLNRDERFKKTLVRDFGELQFTLPPDDPRYVFPVPPIVATNSNL